MCGLYGIYSPNMDEEHREMFIRLAFHSLSRGMHATGIGFGRVRKKGKKKTLHTWWYKAVENAALFMMRPKALEGIHDPTNVVLMGHNRLATIGDAHDLEGAHPFEHKHILGSHNGTIRDKVYDPDKDFASDSDKLFHNIANRGLEDTAKAINNGVFAISFIDRDKGTLNLVKNTMLRDIYGVWDIDGETFMWASERRFLESVSKSSSREWKTIFELQKERMIVIDLLNHKAEVEKVDLDRPFYSSGSGGGKAASGGSNVVPYTRTKGGSYLDDDDGDWSFLKEVCVDRTKVTEYKSCRVLSHSDFPTISHYVEHGDKYVEYSNGLAIPLKVYKKLLNKGCGWCQGFADEDEHVIWLDGSTFLHHSCFNDPGYQLLVTGQ